MAWSVSLLTLLTDGEVLMAVITDGSSRGLLNNRIVRSSNCLRVSWSPFYTGRAENYALPLDMGRRPWADGEQLEHLKSCISKFRAHQATKNLQEFWPSYYCSYLRKFPVEVKEDEIEEAGDYSEALTIKENQTRRVFVSHRRIISILIHILETP